MKGKWFVEEKKEVFYYSNDDNKAERGVCKKIWVQSTHE